MSKTNDKNPRDEQEPYLRMLVDTINKYLTLIITISSILTFIYFYLYFVQLGIPIYTYLSPEDILLMGGGFLLLVILFESIDIASIWLAKQSTNWQTDFRVKAAFFSLLLILFPLLIITSPDTFLSQGIVELNQISILASVFLWLLILAGICHFIGIVFPTFLEKNQYYSSSPA